MLKFLFLLITLSILSYSKDDFGFDTLSTGEKGLNLDLPYFIGIYGGANSITANNVIPVIPGSIDCGIFTYGRGEDKFYGLEGGISFFTEWITNDLKIFYESRPLTLETQTDGPLTLNSNNEYVTFKRDHEWKATLRYLSFDFGVRVRPLLAIENNFGWLKHNWFPLYLRIGYEIGQPTFDAIYENTEFVNSPSNALFPNGRKSRVLESGEIQGGSTTTAFNLEVGAEIKTVGNLHFSPFFSYRLQDRAPYQQYNWDSEVVRFGLAIGFHLNSDALERKRQEKLLIKKRTLSAPVLEENEIIEENEIQYLEEEINITDNFDFENDHQDEDKIITKNIKSFNGNSLEITETTVTQTYPILPYIFFKEESKNIREDYKTEPKGFNEKDLSKNTIEIYYNILRIIGSRLQSDPSLKITLVGTSNGVELDDLNDRIELAQNRAKSIANYFKNEWGVSKDRMKISARELPELITNPEAPEGKEENSRVEIIASDSKLFKPVVHTDFLEYTSNKEGLKFDVETGKNSDIKEVIINLNVDLTTIAKGKVIGNEVIFPPNTLDKIALNMKEGNNLYAELKLIKESEQTETKRIQLPYSKSKSDFEVGRLNLIVFDFNSSIIKEDNKLKIQEFLIDGIKKNSVTDIKGSTDLLGEADYNKRLSFERAKEVADFINTIKPNYEFNSIVGLGSSVLQFDNSTPEGRFYCRTVMIEVKTPFEK